MTAGSNHGSASEDALTHRPTSYAAVGSSRQATVVRYSPPGSTGFERHHELGAGRSRYSQTVDRLLTWHAWRLAGFDVQAGSLGDDTAYQPVQFTDDGAPISRDTEPSVTYTALGEPLLRSGSSASLRARPHLWPFSLLDCDVRVISAIEDRDSVELTVGTLAHPEGDPLISGEVTLSIEILPNHRVVSRARGFVTVTQQGRAGWRRHLALLLLRVRVNQLLDALGRAETSTRVAPSRSDSS